MKPWDQQEGEPDPAYRAARVYFELGPTRTLLAATQALSKAHAGPDRPTQAPKSPSGAFKRWARDWKWSDRARAYDDNLNQVGDKAREAERVNQSTLLEQRRGKISEAEWLLGSSVLHRVAEMLRHPLTETTTQTTTSADGKTTQITTVSPVNWRLRDVVAMARVGIDLQRMSVGLPTRMAVQPFLVPGGDQPPVDQTQADADNGRIPPDLAEVFREEAARRALANAGLDDAQPDD